MNHTVVVGGGAAGAVLAARLSEDPERQVTLVEAGSAADSPTVFLDVSSIPAALPGHPANWSYPAWLRPGTPHIVPRGRLLGGSSAINGGYFVRARAGDFARWAAVGGPEWSFENALPLLQAMEHDLDFGQELGHGASGPVQVRRPDQTGALTTAFVEAARELGFPDEPDKNGRYGHVGVGHVPSNIIGVVRVNTAMAYLAEARGRPNLQILGDTRALRVRIDNGRASGLETETGAIDADDVVLAAGALATPQLLMLSGIGPCEHLESHKIVTVMDLPVGESFSDHPNLAVGWYPTRPLNDPGERFTFPTALNYDSSGSAGNHPEGDLEVLLTVKPIGRLFGGDPRAVPGPGDDEYQFIVALQSPRGRGQISLLSADPLMSPLIEYHHLELIEDRTRMRVGVRTAAQLLRSRAFSSLFRRFSSLNETILADDALLGEWINAHLSTAIHLCGSAPMGPVVDGEGRVHGVRGLRVADTSLLPVVPSREPFHSAVYIGEYIARKMRGPGNDERAKPPSFTRRSQGPH